MAILLAVGASGYHRDELYFLDASHHMQWGYVDQPPGSIAFVWLSRVLFGTSLYGLRLFPALADGAAVFGAALIARELGGGRFPQGLAALALAVSPFLVAGHLAGPTIYDITAWTFVSWLIIRIVRTGNDRLWLAVGVVVGLALLTKETILLLAGGLTIGFLVNRQARIFRSPWLWGGAAIAAAMWAPTLAWQAARGWPTLEMSRNLQREHSGAGYAASFFAIQLLLPGWWVAPVWIGGLVALLRDARFRAYRAFGLAYLTLFVLLLVFVADRPYYLAGLYPALFAAGSIVARDVVAGTRRFLVDRRAKRRLIWRSPRAAIVWVSVLGALSLPVSLPILPASALAKVPLQAVNYNLGEVIGWPQLTATVARVYRSLPDAERRRTVVLTANYGEAGAIDRYGPALGLPRAYSGHNNEWWWGPPLPGAAGGTAVVVGWDSASSLTPYFRQVRLAAVFRSPHGVDNDENGARIWICTGLRRPWPAIWPAFRHYG